MTAPATPPPPNAHTESKAKSLLSQVIGTLRKKRRPPQESQPDIQQTAAEAVPAEQSASEAAPNPETTSTSSKNSALPSSDMPVPKDEGVLLALEDTPASSPGSASASMGTTSDAGTGTHPLAFRPSLYRDAIAHEPPPTTWWEDLQAILPLPIVVPGGGAATTSVALAAPIAGVALVASGGAAVGSSAGAAAVPASGPVLNVLPALGPVIHSDNLAFRAYTIQAGANGGTQLQPLDNVQVKWNTDGTAVVNLNGYKGLVMLSLYSTKKFAQIDSNFGGDYIDEATGKGTLLGDTVLRTIGVADSSNSLHLALSPLTETLVRMLGFASADNGATVLSSSIKVDTDPSGALRTKASALASLCNTLLGLKDDDAKALSTESLLGFGGELTLAVDSSGYPVPNGDVHGQVLSLISSYQKQKNIGPSEAISQLVQEWAQLTPATASQSASFTALKTLTQFSPAGTLSLSAGQDKGYGSLKDSPPSDNGTLSDNRIGYRQPLFDLAGLEKTQLHVGDVLQVVDSSNNAVISSYRIGSDTGKDNEVLNSGTLTGILTTGLLSPGDNKLYAQVLSSTGITHRGIAALTVTVDTTVADVLSATLALDQSDTSDSSNASQGGRGTSSDKITNIRKPTILVNGLSGKAFQVKDRIEILDTRVTNSMVGYYYVQAGDLDASGNWASKTALDIQINQSLADVSDKTTNGIHDLIVSVTDSAGNYTSKPSTPQLTITIDATAPIPTLQLPSTNSNGIKQDELLNADRAVELKLSYPGMTAGDVVRVLVNDKPLLINNVSEPYKHIISSSDVNANSTWTFSLSGSDFAKISPVNGANSVSVEVTDLAGNKGITATSQSIWWGPPQLSLPGDSKGFTNGNWINAGSSKVNLQLSKIGLDTGDQIVITDGNGHNTAPYTLVSADFVAGQDWVTIPGVARSEIGTGVDGSFNLSAQVKRNNNVVYTSTPVSVKVDTVAPVVDLNGSAAGNDTTNTIAKSDATVFNTKSRLFPLYATAVASGGAAITDTDIAQIQLVFPNQSNTLINLLQPGDKLRLGATDLQKDFDFATAKTQIASSVTIEGVTQMVYSYDANKTTLSIWLLSGNAMNKDDVKNVLLGMQFSGSATGTRDVSVHFLDQAGNDTSAHLYLVL